MPLMMTRYRCCTHRNNVKNAHIYCQVVSVVVWNEVEVRMKAGFGTNESDDDMNSLLSHVVQRLLRPKHRFTFRVALQNKVNTDCPLTSESRSPNQACPACALKCFGSRMRPASCVGHSFQEQALNCHGIPPHGDAW